MNFRLYKPGQGYWMRVITAAFFGALILAAAAWLWNESEAVELPARGYTIPVEGFPAGVTPGAGDQIALLMENPDPAATERITVGTGSITNVELTASGATLTTDKLALAPGRDPFDASRFSITPPAGAAAQPYEVRLYGTLRPIEMFEKMYLQAGLAGAAILIGAVLLFYYISVNPKTGEFLIATDGEMKKVNWSTRKEVVGSTWVVVTTCFLMAGVLFVVDFLFKELFTLLGVFEKL